MAKDRILGLDVSSVCVGYAVFEGDSPKQFGKYHQRGKDHGERLMRFRTWLLALLTKQRPDHVVVEAPYAGPRRFAYGVLMMYTAVVLMTYFEWAEVELPAVNQVRAVAVKRILKARKGSSHEERKRLMVEAMNKEYGLTLRFKAKDRHKEVSDDDVADAIAVTRAWLIEHGRSVNGR